MKTVYDVKQELDPELYVRQVERWQAARRLREGRRYPDSLIYLSTPWQDEPESEPQQDTISGPLKFAMGFAAAVLLLGLLALIV